MHMYINSFIAPDVNLEINNKNKVVVLLGNKHIEKIINNKTLYVLRSHDVKLRSPGLAFILHFNYIFSFKTVVKLFFPNIFLSILSTIML